MKGFKRYERYKDSGVEWIGEIPEHWHFSRFKNFVKVINEKIEGNETNNNLQYVGLENIESFTGKLIEGTSENFGEGISNIFYSTDVLFGKLRPYLAKVLLPSINGRCSTELLVFRPIDNSLVDRTYLYYYCLSDGFINVVNSSTYGVRMPRANWDFISLLPFTVPSLREQQAITNFLDQKTAKIDSLIADKEKLIELLQEQRQAIITQAVTKGLDPNVPMKDSGVEWIGEIPEHWEVTKIKYVSRINHHALSEDCDDDFEIQYIDIGGVDSNGQIIEIKKMRFGDAPSRARRIVKDGDTIVSTVRTYLKAITWVEKADDNLICSTGFAVLSPTKLINPQYLLFLMRSTQYIDEIVSRSVGVSYPAINSRDIGKIECLLPPYKEQKYIVDYINKKGKPLTDLIDCINEQILKLKEYRQSLITAAVTGKIDVRDYFNEGEEKEEQEEVS